MRKNTWPRWLHRVFVPGAFVHAALCSVTTLFIAASHAQTTGGNATAPSLTPEQRRLSPIGAMRLGADERVKLDGKLDEPFWQRATPINEFFEYSPREGAVAKFMSEARIAFDDKALYIGLTAFDPDPSKINAPLVRRDEVYGSQDFFAVQIDPIGNRKFAQIFRISASGGIGDGLVSEDSGNEDFSPDFEWDAQASRNENGWTAELRIPFSTLRYSQPASENWSILVVRGIARDEVYRFGNARIPRDSNSFMLFAQTLTGMTDLPAGREFTVTPQLTARRTSDRTDGGRTANRNNFIVGADVKYRPRPDLVFDATINPDFSQVELDSPQLAANAQFALFFPEKRPFFLEGADILSTPINAIYTRAISDPAWGARVTQRNDGTDFVFLTVRDDGKGLILLPGALNTNTAVQDTKSQATIARFRANVGNVTVGALFTDRTYEKIKDSTADSTLTNRVGGVDVVWKPNGELRLRAQALVSRTDDRRNQDSIADGTPKSDTDLLADYNYRDEKWNLAGGIERSGRGFRADNGFISQAGYRNIYQETQRKWKEVGIFNEISPLIFVAQKRDEDGRILEEVRHLGVYLGLPRSTSFFLEWRPAESVRARPDGDTKKRSQFFANFSANPGKVISSFYMEGLFGERFDFANNRVTNGYFYNASANIRLGDRLEIEPRIDNSVLTAKEDVIGSKRILQERAFQLKSVYHFTARDTLRLIAQYNAVRRAPSLYQSANVSPFEKTETISLVYGHRRGLGTNLYVGATNSRTIDPSNNFKRTQNEVFVKWSWAFDLAGLL
jgi:Domain of unknown function (DUF5916)